MSHGKATKLAAALVQAGEERRLWEMAGAKRFSFLMAPSQVISLGRGMVKGANVTQVYRKGVCDA